MLCRKSARTSKFKFQIQSLALILHHGKLIIPLICDCYVFYLLFLSAIFTLGAAATTCLLFFPSLEAITSKTFSTSVFPSRICYLRFLCNNSFSDIFPHFIKTLFCICCTSTISLVSNCKVDSLTSAITLLSSTYISKIFLILSGRTSKQKTVSNAKVIIQF